MGRHIALHYSTAFYFVVNKNNKKLAEALTKGLEESIQDGSFDALLKQCCDKSIKRAAFDGRTIIEMINPLLPAETLLARKELWFSRFSQK